MKSSDRYGTPRSLPLGARVVLILSICAALVVLLWSAWQYAAEPIRTQVVSFSALDDRSMTVRYQVTRRHGDERVRCTIEAQDYDRNIVGELTDTIEPGLGTLTRTVTVPTRVRAVVALIQSCRPAPTP